MFWLLFCYFCDDEEKETILEKEIEEKKNHTHRYSSRKTRHVNDM